jgi:ATP-dependent protease HslVU (ClpYQ) peptidase subunit
MMVVMANPHGIFGVYPMREVYEFSRFWAIGSGRKFAMGALFAAYDSDLSALELAELGVKAGCEFDVSSSLPMTSYTLTLSEESKHD